MSLKERITKIIAMSRAAYYKWNKKMGTQILAIGTKWIKVLFYRVKDINNLQNNCLISLNTWQSSEISKNSQISKRGLSKSFVKTKILEAIDIVNNFIPKLNLSNLKQELILKLN